MVELKLEALDDNLSRDFYVSIRVGEVQKLSRINKNSVYKFPAGAVGDRKVGKIEVFKKIGACSVGIVPQDGVDQEVSVQLGDDKKVKFRVYLNADSDKRAQAEVAPVMVEDKPPTREIAEVNPKVQAAKAYLEEHNLEMRLSEAMQAVLRVQPEDPAAFVAEKLAKSAGMVQKLPKTEEQAPALSAPLVPTRIEAESPPPAVTEEAPPKSAPPAPARTEAESLPQAATEEACPKAVAEPAEAPVGAALAEASATALEETPVDAAPAEAPAAAATAEAPAEAATAESPADAAPAGAPAEAATGFPLYIPELPEAATQTAPAVTAPVVAPADATPVGAPAEPASAEAPTAAAPAEAPAAAAPTEALADAAAAEARAKTAAKALAEAALAGQPAKAAAAEALVEVAPAEAKKPAEVEKPADVRTEAEKPAEAPIEAEKLAEVEKPAKGSTVAEFPVMVPNEIGAPAEAPAVLGKPSEPPIGEEKRAEAPTQAEKAAEVPAEAKKPAEVFLEQAEKPAQGTTENAAMREIMYGNSSPPTACEKPVEATSDNAGNSSPPSACEKPVEATADNAAKPDPAEVTQDVNTASSVGAVAEKLAEAGLGDFVKAFLENGWDVLADLPDMTDSDLVELGLEEDHRNKFLKAFPKAT